jgi:hypothetical protein
MRTTLLITVIFAAALGFASVASAETGKSGVVAPGQGNGVPGHSFNQEPQAGGSPGQQHTDPDNCAFAVNCPPPGQRTQRPIPPNRPEGGGKPLTVEEEFFGDDTAGF